MHSLVEQIQGQIAGWRRRIHRQPELGFQEHKTAALIVETLEPMGYRIQTGIGRTGVVAEHGQGKPVIALRADMDALPIQEENKVSYASEVPGVMHACGHDAHVAMALGTAGILVREGHPGTVRLLFQPSEEAGDEQGVSGAQRMLEDGALQDVDAILALHVDASLPVGLVTIDPGPFSAGVDSFFATVYGIGGHGAMPQKAVDPVHITAHVLLALHGIVSRKIRPHDAAVVTVGAIHGGRAENVIPQQVDLAGTIRFMNEEVHGMLKEEIEHALRIARIMGGDYDLRFEHGAPAIVNDPGIVRLLRQVSVDVLGREGVQEARPEMGAEDFSFFTQEVPGAMFMLGAGIEGDERSHHHPRFDIDERCLPIGAAILSMAVLELLQSGPPQG